MKSGLVVPVFILTAYNVFLINSREPIVTTSLGKILGKFENGFYSFHNIPYAEPPIGSRRFSPPQPFTQGWSEIRDGTQVVMTCVGFGKYKHSPGGEDCLYVHIVTPNITCDRSYPVRVHIHGGGFMTGSPADSDTSILAKRGMIVVTMGYRLGPLGFFSTGDQVISGNNGLKDQFLALKWTKDNIQSFCGDTSKILLAGVSAGGASAHMHLLRKSTENYVSAVASHNGVAFCPWAFETKPEEIRKLFAEFLNCPLKSENLKNCLINKSIKELKEATNSLQYYENNPITVFSPVIESVKSEDPFITQHPEEIIRSGKIANVTWLVAYTEHEGACFAAQFLQLDQNGKPEINVLNDRWSELAPILFFFNTTMSNQEKLEYSIFLKQKYFGDKEFTEENYRLLKNMYTDIFFLNDIHKAIDLHRKFCPGKLYSYLYKYPQKYALGNLFSSRTDISLGADHLADTVFTIPYLPLKQTSLTEKDTKVSEKLLDMYLTWANTGTLSFGGMELPLITPTEKSKLTINEDCFSFDDCTAQKQPGCSCYGF